MPSGPGSRQVVPTPGRKTDRIVPFCLPDGLQVNLSETIRLKLRGVSANSWHPSKRGCWSNFNFDETGKIEMRK